MASGSAKQIAYVPILKWKMGEQRALAALESDVRRCILPLAEIQGRPYDWQSEKYTRTWEKHIEMLVKATKKSWGDGEEIAFDQPLDGSEGLEKGPWSYLFESLWHEGVNAVPVISSWASEEEVDALALLVRPRVEMRFVLRYRLDVEIGEESAKQASNWFRKTLRALGALHADSDAVLDLGHYAGDSNMPSYCADVLSELALQGPWRTLTLASGAFPANLAGVSRGAHTLPRNDWKLYREVEAKVSTRLLFGDYGVNYTDAFEMDPRTIRMSANLRYTHFDYWRVYKAKSVKDYGYDQYKELCQLLVDSEEFFGPDFSEGDKMYFEVATSASATSGNATTWRRDATNHHIQLVIHQLHKELLRL